MNVVFPLMEQAQCVSSRLKPIFNSGANMSACPKVVLNKLLVVDELEFGWGIDDEWNRMQFEQELWEDDGP